MGYQVNVMQCMQPNFLLTGQVYPMLMSRKSTLSKLIAKFFPKGVVFMFWHDIVCIKLLYCVKILSLF